LSEKRFHFSGMRSGRGPDTLAARWARLAPHTVVATPQGPGPFPGVLMFHGCGQRGVFLDGYARALAAEAMIRMTDFLAGAF
jgi:hypothetical protein